MNVISLVEAHLQSSELMHESLGLLHYPAHDSQPAAMLGVALGQEGLDAPVTQLLAVRLTVVSTIGVSFLGFGLRRPDLAADGRYGLDQRQQLRAIVDVGGRDNPRQRRAVGIDRQMMLGSRFCPVHGAGSRFFPPCIARTEVESNTTFSRSRAPAWRRWSSSTACNSSQTPALRHSSRRFHRVIPQQPISWGKSSQGMPVLSTKRIPVRQTRSGTRGLPPLGLGTCLGSSGSTIPQNSSVTKSLDMMASSMNKCHHDALNSHARREAFF